MNIQFKDVTMVAVCGALIVGIASPTRAAIPVIDTSNIAQQIKTFEQTLQVVTNTRNQIELQVKELQSLEDHIINQYESDFKNSVSSVMNSLKKSNFFSASTEWNNFWQKTYPRISADILKTALHEREIKSSMNQMLSLKNQQDVDTYRGLMSELNTATNRLQSLLALNKTPAGSKQAAQLSNEIAIEKAHIESIHSSIQAVSSQNQAMKNQAEVTEKLNRETVIKQEQQAETEVVAKMNTEVKKTASIMDDPWKKYGGDK